MNIEQIPLDATIFQQVSAAEDILLNIKATIGEDVEITSVVYEVKTLDKQGKERLFRITANVGKL